MIVPAIKVFRKAYQLDDVTIVADAGMISAANLQRDTTRNAVAGGAAAPGPASRRAS